MVVAQYCECSNDTELYTLKGLCYVKFTSMKSKENKKPKRVGVETD